MLSIKDHFIAAGYIKMSPFGIFYLTESAEEIEGDYKDLEKILDDLLDEMAKAGFVYNSEEKRKRND